jgi:hypothetical protein
MPGRRPDDRRLLKNLHSGASGAPRHLTVAGPLGPGSVRSGFSRSEATSAHCLPQRSPEANASVSGDGADDVAAGAAERVDTEAAQDEDVGQRTVHDLLHLLFRGGAVNLVDAHPVVLTPGDDDAAQSGLGGQADPADRAVDSVGVVQGQAGLGQRRGDLDDECGKRVLVGEPRVPVAGSRSNCSVRCASQARSCGDGPRSSPPSARAIPKVGRAPTRSAVSSAPAAQPASARSRNGPATTRPGP